MEVVANSAILMTDEIVRRAGPDVAVRGAWSSH